MSFFDEGDAPRIAGRPRRSTARGGEPDADALRNRRLLAGGAGLVVLLILIFGIKSCVSSAHRNALSGYAHSVATINQDSQTQVSQPFFALLTSGAQPIELQSKADDIRASADALLRRAEGLSAPGALGEAHRDLILELVLRRDAIARIASKLPAALSDQGNSTAIGEIAGQMQSFIASDVLYSQRVVPLVRLGLKSGGVSESLAPDPGLRFLGDFAWLDPNTVATRLSAPVGATAGVPPGGIAPGLHGHGLTSTAINGMTLQSGQPNHITLGPSLSFTVTLQNQGDTNEKNVPVTVTVTGGGAPINLHTVIPQTIAHQSATATLPLPNPPPSGSAVTIKTSIAPVPGEKNTSNNGATYPALFSK